MTMPNIHVTVTLTPVLRLEQAVLYVLGYLSECIDPVLENNPSFVTELTVNGTLTEDDFRFICENTGVVTEGDFRYIRENLGKNLQKLDLSNASVESTEIFILKNCKELTSVIIPVSMFETGRNAFYGCTALTSVSIRDTVVETECGTFPRNAELTTVQPFNSLFPFYESKNGVLFNKDITELILYPHEWQGDYIIPSSVIKIRENAFYDCIGLTSIIIPNSVIEIGEYAFCHCTALSSVIISATVMQIGRYAFDEHS